MANGYQIRIFPGRRWSAVYTYRNKTSGDLIDLTSYTAEFRLGDDLTLTQGSGITLGGVAGTATVVITAAQATTLGALASSGIWELDVVSGGGIPVANEPLQGSYTIEPRPLG